MSHFCSQIKTTDLKLLNLTQTMVITQQTHSSILLGIYQVVISIKFESNSLNPASSLLLFSLFSFKVKSKIN